MTYSHEEQTPSGWVYRSCILFVFIGSCLLNSYEASRGRGIAMMKSYDPDTADELGVGSHVAPILAASAALVFSFPANS